MKRNGFTLVELLTVIIILSLVLAIAYPKVSSLIENEKQKLSLLEPLYDEGLVFESLDTELKLLNTLRPIGAGT